jgi:hypothetical protein
MGDVAIRRPSFMMDTNFQARSSKDGFSYEDVVFNHLLTITDSIRSKVRLPEIGIEADFAYTLDGVQYYVEAKGGRQSRPGAQRTDNVKKALVNGFLIHHWKPDARFVVYFSARPQEGLSSSRMIEAALESNSLHEVRYLDYNGMIL